ncbi:MAG: response regulator transcription factor [Burkholderiales bacterium]|jgi:DNA-binding NarL/FixJ family response regulator|nr:response regulator transcription factor [Burkholderiales bacterium]
MNSIAKVLIVEDHPLFAASICDIIGLVAPGTSTLRIENLDDFARVYEEFQPDLVIADLNLGTTSGLDTCWAIRDIDAKVPLMISTADTDFIESTADEPQNNFWRLNKNDDFQSFVESIADVMITVGLSPSWRLQNSLLSVAESGLKTMGSPVGALELTQYQQSLMEMVALGLSNKEIAKRLNISPDTVKHHLTELFSKFNATSRTQAATIYRGMVSTRISVAA